MEAPGSSKKMIATQEEMVEAKVPLAYRDHSERHTYEKCEYELIMERMLQMQKICEREAQLKSPPIPLLPKTTNA
ncbi:hypothetical protein SASPL_125096 [Salvia splendens]|uniref:NADH dehydrogenase [ubiquinone] 1 beta subcomplex subunit 7 n=1 Tax=Salvia splendens TaxID=180675 RepID=A0A8X8XFA6_SALSN|nr:hypothetical protein SASPL_125096 [Salvia splendens]